MKTFVEWSGFGGVVSHAAHSLRDSSVLRQILGDEEYDKIMNKEQSDDKSPSMLSEESGDVKMINVSYTFSYDEDDDKPSLVVRAKGHQVEENKVRKPSKHAIRLTEELLSTILEEEITISNASEAYDTLSELLEDYENASANYEINGTKATMIIEDDDDDDDDDDDEDNDDDDDEEDD